MAGRNMKQESAGTSKDMFKKEWDNTKSLRTIYCINGILFLVFFLFPSFAHAIWPFGPNNYDECITDGMKGTASNIAARLIVNSCKKKFWDEDLTVDPKYHDCILKEMKGISSDMAARAIVRVCRDRFPQPTYQYKGGSGETDWSQFRPKYE